MNKKIAFVAFAIEDETQRNLFSGQRQLGKCPVEFIDMSVKKAYESEWKDKVRARIRRSDCVIVLVSKNSLQSSGQKWEIECAKTERKPILAVWAYSNDRTALPGLTVREWKWTTVSDFIDNL